MARRVWWVIFAVAAGCSKSNPLPANVGDDVSSRTTTAFNAPSTPQEMAVKCDVPIYPGAQAPDNLTRMPRKDNDGNLMLELVLTSHDSPKKVADFYSHTLKLPITSAEGTLSLVGMSPKHNELMLAIVHEGGQTVIRVHSIAHSSA